MKDMISVRISSWQEDCAGRRLQFTKRKAKIEDASWLDIMLKMVDLINTIDQDGFTLNKKVIEKLLSQYNKELMANMIMSE